MVLEIVVDDNLYDDYKKAFENQDIVKDIDEVTRSVVECAMKNIIKIYSEYKIDK